MPTKEEKPRKDYIGGHPSDFVTIDAEATRERMRNDASNIWTNMRQMEGERWLVLHPEKVADSQILQAMMRHPHGVHPRSIVEFMNCAKFPMYETRKASRCSTIVFDRPDIFLAPWTHDERDVFMQMLRDQSDNHLYVVPNPNRPFGLDWFTVANKV